MKQVIVVPYNPLWPQAFVNASREISYALGGILLQIHHIGSTSIPGMDAKPVIDMLGVVSDLTSLDEQSMAMKALGYEVMGEFGISGRRYFRRNDATGKRTHQLHVFQIGSPHIQRHLAFRDFLRTHPDEAAQYAELKRRLAAAHPNNIEAYMDGKDGFIKQTEAAALAWAASRVVAL